ncbi:MAG: hypothetical protein GWP91_17065 [Rhodobacterales bacterium]|nr:hypothetical protein [Rhodobacterales bacterium]
MLEQLISDLKGAPEKINDGASRLNERRQELTDQARTRVLTARGDGAERLWHFQTNTLEAVGAVLEKGHDLPVVGRIADKAVGLVGERLEAHTTPTIEAYDDKNAKDIIAAVRDLTSNASLVAIRAYETGHKARKTVLKAVDVRIASLPELVAA